MIVKGISRDAGCLVLFRIPSKSSMVFPVDERIVLATARVILITGIPALAVLLS